MTDLREKIFVSLLPYISARATEATNAVLAVLREQEPAGEWTEKGNRAELRPLYAAHKAASDIVQTIERRNLELHAEIKRLRTENVRVMALDSDRCRVANSYLIDNARLADKLAAAQAVIEQMREVIAWYADETRALAKHMAGGAHTQAVLASVTVLALDGGRRADSVLAAYYAALLHMGDE